jgi:hypothetical protein
VHREQQNMKKHHLTILVSSALIVATPVTRAFDVNDQLSIGGLLVPAGQCQSVSALLPGKTYGEELLDGAGDPIVDPATGESMVDDTMDSFGDECRGGIPFQLEVSYHPNEQNELFFKLGFAVDNGLKPVSPWNRAPWGADLKDDVTDINGSDRDYLLTAWYKYTHAFQNDSSLGTTIGIIDSTDYIDGNEYANDEHTQFMNEVFVNSGSYSLGAYDAGAALEFEYEDWTFTGLGMNVGENDDGENYNYWSGEAGYHLETSMGAGNYRFIFVGTNKKFLDPTGEKNEALLAYGISFDQAFGEIVGGWIRFAWADESAALYHKAGYSGGLNFSGKAWNRDEDNIGIAYAYLDGGNLDIENTLVAEAYYRAVMNEYVAITADIQYMADDLITVDPRQDNPDGWIFGLRIAAEF